MRLLQKGFSTQLVRWRTEDGRQETEVKLFYLFKNQTHSFITLFSARIFFLHEIVGLFDEFTEDCFIHI